MTNTESTNTMPAKAIRGKLIFVTTCGIITPSTQLQSGLRDSLSANAPRRLFFGEHTEPESFELIKQIYELYPNISSLSAEVELRGHYKSHNGQIDERALFVESISPVAVK